MLLPVVAMDLPDMYIAVVWKGGLLLNFSMFITSHIRVILWSSIYTARSASREWKFNILWQINVPTMISSSKIYHSTKFGWSSLLSLPLLPLACLSFSLSILPIQEKKAAQLPSSLFYAYSYCLLISFAFFGNLHSSKALISKLFPTIKTLLKLWPIRQI